MGFFDMLRSADINQLYKDYSNTEKAMLLDVRTVGEYSSGHIPGSKNIPLDVIHSRAAQIAEKDIPLFVYCHSGARSRAAVKRLKALGFSSVTDMGGITGYSGKLER